MKVLLFGGAGYIGTHVALAFTERGDTVGIFDNFSSGLRSNIMKGSAVFEADVMDKKAIDDALSDFRPDAVIHLAAFKAAGESMTDPEKFSVNNITGSLNIITSCVRNKVKNFVLSSSAAVYGEPVYLPIDEDHPARPENYYGYTKLAIEENLRWYDKLKGLRFASLRYFNAAGYDPDGKMTGLEHNPANLIPVVMEVAAGTREKLQIFGSDYDTKDGTGVRDYVHVSDLADAHVKALDYITAHDASITVNLGSDTGLSVAEIVEKAREITGKAIPANYVDRRPGDPAKLVASSKKARRLLNWEPKYSSLESIIESTWKVYSSKDFT
jgi:UDP-glucose 4-epimerase